MPKPEKDKKKKDNGQRVGAKSISSQRADSQKKERDRFNRSIIDSALRIADRIKAKSLFLIVDDPRQYQFPETIVKRSDLKLVISNREAEEQARKLFKTVLTIPDIKLSRLAKIKMAVMGAISKGMVELGDRIVCVCGVKEFKTLDTLVVIEIGKEYEILSSKEVGNISSSIHPGVFEELLRIAVELAHQGREGKPIGTIFVLGDSERVMQLSRQMIFNPFQGYPEEERNILDPSLRETIKEFASLDGAFIIRDDGVVLAAGRYLNASIEDASLPQGLGSRHAAAAGITALTDAIAIVISESTGDVRIFKNGKIFMEIEKETPQRPS